MKAKVYAERILKNLKLPGAEFDKIVVSVIQDLCGEVIAITKSRHCACDAAYTAVFDEVDDRWITICRIVNDTCNMKLLKPTGFREIVFNQADKAGFGWEVKGIWKPRRIA